MELIGASIEAIDRGENREVFKKIVAELGGESARSVICHSMDDLFAAAEDLGYPMVVRPSFTMGGTGSGMAYDEEDLRRIGGGGLAASPTTEVLLEESIIGWKEYELEVMRDTADNVVIICSIENLDPMGVHTGDSITVAPAMTLTDREYQAMRDMAIGIIRAVGVDTGGCNIQYAVNPEDGRLIVIEMNPRVSRSSALASKATGFPIAKIAAKVAIGYTLDEIRNDITQETPASFEPTLDYVVVKVPRFAFEKFPGADPTLTTHMKSVGEAMAIGRNFTESLQKALRSLESKGAIFDFAAPVGDKAALLEKSRTPTDGRLRTVMDAIRAGATPEEVFEATGIDPWFVDQLFLIKEVADEVAAAAELDHETLRTRQAARLLRRADRRHPRHARGRRARRSPGARPAARLQDRRHLRRRVRRADALPLLVLRRGDRGGAAGRGQGSRHHPRQRTQPHRPGDRVRLLLRPRQLALSEAGYETIMVNCNPETVSTDYDTSDRLYFEPLTLEDVLEIVHAEQQAGPIAGVICQLGGQTPLGLAQGLADAGVKIVGTQPEAIHLAEERGAFGKVLAEAGLPAPKHGMAHVRSRRQADRRRASAIPCWCARRTSWVDAAWRSSTTTTGCAPTSRRPPRSAREHPVLVDRFIDDAVEIDVDAHLRRRGALPRRRDGAHRGGRHPLRRLLVRAAADHARARPRSCASGTATEAIARGVGVRGLLNIQFALGSDVLYVLEANPRASPHGAVRLQGDRDPAGQGGRAGDAGRVDRRPARRRPAARARRRRPPRRRTDRGQGGGDAVQPVQDARRPQRRHRARAGDEVDRRGDGLRRRLRHRLRQGADRGLRLAARRAVACSSRSPTATSAT